MQRFTPVAGLLTGGVLVAVFGCPGPSPHEGPGAGGSGGATNTGATSSRGVSVTGSAVDSSARATTGTAGPGTGGTVITSNSGVGGASGPGGQGAGGQGASGQGGAGGMNHTSASAGPGGTGGGPVCDDGETFCPLLGCVDTTSNVEACGGCTACSKSNVMTGKCIGSTCQPVCKPGYHDVDATANDGCEVRVARVFVTEGTYKIVVSVTGGTRGVALADENCGDAGPAPTAGMKWSAWLSDPTLGSPSDRFEKSEHTKYVLLGTSNVIAKGWTDLTDGTIAFGIHVTENGPLPAGTVDVWTATMPDGTASGFDCGSWQSLQSMVDRGSAGSKDEAWTHQANPVSCTAEMHLYCFEEPI